MVKAGCLTAGSKGFAAVSNSLKRRPWYVSGLHFECQECGRCCSGPESGYIWANRNEVERMADYLKISVGEFRSRFMRRVSLRWTLIEEPLNRNCIFLRDAGGCSIYPVRPRQCRTWPFWASNLTDAAAWNRAAQRCPGINRGKLYSFEEIRRIKKGEKWWQQPTAK